MSNKSIGNKFETEFCDLMYKHGWWAHNMAQNSAGQPADVIAVKGNQAILLDCKVVSTPKGFALSRMEDNQRLSMNLWQKRTDYNAWFSIKYEQEGEIFMLRFTQLDLLRKEKSYLTYQDARCYGKRFDDWINECNH